jgi:transcriptional regulator with XRE-family HTH domain
MKTTLGQTLKAARIALHLTQRQLALQAGVKPAHIAYLENDRRRPSLGLLSKLANILGLEQDKLFVLAHPEARPLLRAKPQERSRDDAWRAFIKNKLLLARYHVDPRELKMLAQANLLGSVIAPRDFLFILNSIRQAADTEE